jgi:antitoxin component YwqK of YwqJK toxin-antitoxin module
MIFAQNNKPKLEAVGDLVKATSFHDNGKVQVVFYKNGKLQGEWVSFDSNKTAMATYDNGQKSEKWFFERYCFK